MISDNTFRYELDATLKCRGLLKKERNKIIEDYLQLNIDRNDVLDMEKEITLQYKDSKVKPKSEAMEQMEFVSWFKQTYPHIAIMMVRNDGYRTPRERQEQLNMGLLPGASDLLIPDHMLWLELKRSDGGAGQSQEQKDFEQGRIKAGQTYLLCNGADEAKRHVQAILG